MAEDRRNAKTCGLESGSRAGDLIALGEVARLVPATGPTSIQPQSPVHAQSPAQGPAQGRRQHKAKAHRHPSSRSSRSRASPGHQTLEWVGLARGGASGRAAKDPAAFCAGPRDENGFLVWAASNESFPRSDHHFDHRSAGLCWEALLGLAGRGLLFWTSTPRSECWPGESGGKEWT